MLSTLGCHCSRVRRCSLPRVLRCRPTFIVVVPLTFIVVVVSPPPCSSLLLSSPPCVRWCPAFVGVPLHSLLSCCCPPCSLSSSLLPFAIPIIRVHTVVRHLCTFVISTSISPYKQWHVGGVVVLSDVAPIATLRAEACSGGLGHGWAMSV
jgi:hypothetical protein